MNWRIDAACRDMGEMFFPDYYREPWIERAAKEVCAECPVRQQCLDEAMTFEGSASSNGRFGIWGGLNPAERASLYRGKSPFKPAECGTDSGYHRHKRVYKEPACDACMEAHRVADRARVARKRAKAEGDAA